MFYRKTQILQFFNFVIIPENVGVFTEIKIWRCERIMREAVTEFQFDEYLQKYFVIKKLQQMTAFSKIFTSK